MQWAPKVDQLSTLNLRSFSKYGLLFLLGISSWIPILVINFRYWITFLHANQAVFPPYLTEEVRAGLFAIFVIFNFFLVQQLLKTEKWDVIDLLWKLLVIGISGISVTFLFTLLEEYTLVQNLYAYIKPLSVSVGLYAVLIFSLSTMFIFRKLILYQKNKRKVISWNILQGVYLLGLVRLFLGYGDPQNAGLAAEITNISTSIFIPVFFGISLFLSANVNWSAYLNFNQKLKSLFLLFIIILIFVAFFSLFPFHALPDMQDFLGVMTGPYLIFGLLFLFPFIYALLSSLVLIFNLQTSSVFEQRSIELATIQRINQSIQSNLDAEEILRTLLDAGLLTSNATGGWIETVDAKGEHREISYMKNVSREEVKYLRNKEDLTAQVLENKTHYYVKNLRKHKSLRYARTRLRSLLALPIFTSSKPIGVVYLVNELTGSFEEASILSLVSLTEQSGISIENAELVSRSIGLEIYREQLKIAKTFQQNILPQALPGTDQIEFFVMSQEVDEIGGDFYDVNLQDQTYKIAMGDVSGKGTTAAFYMAETKGIFQALTVLDMGVRDFILTANKALSQCLRKGSFMTLTYVHIDMDQKEIELLRAGHCQTLYYDSESDELLSLEEGSPGLGIIRNNSFGKYVPEPEKRNFRSGDLMILFTDGIIEAHNTEREEFGFERLNEIVYRLRKTDSRLIAETLVQQVKAFTGGIIDDDYSILVIKFL